MEAKMARKRKTTAKTTKEAEVKQESSAKTEELATKPEADKLEEPKKEAPKAKAAPKKSEPKAEPKKKEAPKAAPAKPAPTGIKLQDAARRYVVGYKDHWISGILSFAKSQGFTEPASVESCKDILRRWGAKLK